MAVLETMGVESCRRRRRRHYHPIPLPQGIGARSTFSHLHFARGTLVGRCESTIGLRRRTMLFAIFHPSTSPSPPFSLYHTSCLAMTSDSTATANTSTPTPVCDVKSGSNTIASMQEHSHPGSHSHSHSHGGSSAVEHGHTHEIMDHPGKFGERDVPNYASRNWNERAFTVGIGGPVGSGKTALLLALCKRLRDTYNVGVVTNDIFTREDQEFLVRNAALQDPNRIRAVETGGCPHAAIREDISANMEVLEQLQAEYGTQILFVESGGDNLAAAFSVELSDFHVYVIDVSGGDKIPRKGGPGISQSDLLVINKTDLAEHVGASLDVMRRDADRMRDHGPTVFTSVRKDQGVDAVADLILAARRAAGADHAGHPPTESRASS